MDRLPHDCQRLVWMWYIYGLRHRLFIRTCKGPCKGHISVAYTDVAYGLLTRYYVQGETYPAPLTTLMDGRCWVFRALETVNQQEIRTFKDAVGASAGCIPAIVFDPSTSMFTEYDSPFMHESMPLYAWVKKYTVTSGAVQHRLGSEQYVPDPAYA